MHPQKRSNELQQRITKTIVYLKTIRSDALEGSEVAQSWPDKLGQLDKWSFCLTTAKMAVEQERR